MTLREVSVRQLCVWRDVLFIVTTGGRLLMAQHIALASAEPEIRVVDVPVVEQEPA